MAHFLEIDRITKVFGTTSAGAAAINVIDGISMNIDEGEVVVFLGPSGCGKSTLMRMVGGLETPTTGRIVLEGREVKGPDRQKGMVFQSYSSFPWLKVLDNVRFGLRFRTDIDAAEKDRIARHYLRMVGLGDFEDYWVNRISGGMRQRVAIAIALLNKPDVIIADEPTTALDVTIQGQILYEMQKLCRESGAALVWITHDLSVIAGLADKVAVMYAGRIVETGTVGEVLDQSRHPYTRGLMGSVPACNPRGQPLKQIPGMTPSLLSLGAGCAFRERCDRATAKCDAMPALGGESHAVRCHHPHGAAA